MGETVYEAGQMHEMHHLYANELLPLHERNDTWGIAPWTGQYDGNKLRNVWEILTSVTPSPIAGTEGQCARDSGGYNNAMGFDLVDVGREYLSTQYGAGYYRCMMDAYHEGAAAKFHGNNDTTAMASRVKAAGNGLIKFVNDLDTLLSSQQGFTMGEWINATRALGHTAEEKAFYEWNGRSQVTLWVPCTRTQNATTLTRTVRTNKGKAAAGATDAAGAADAAATGQDNAGLGRGYSSSPVNRLTFNQNGNCHDPEEIPGLSDYAAKTWGGLERQYHAVRQGIFLKRALAFLEQPGAGVFDKLSYDREVLDFAIDWDNAPWDPTTLPPNPVGDPVDISRKLIDEYPALGPEGLKCPVA